MKAKPVIIPRCFNTSPSVSALPVDEVPDGGYDWVVVSASSSHHVWAHSPLFSRLSRPPVTEGALHLRKLLRSIVVIQGSKVRMLFLGSGIAIFPLLVPPFLHTASSLTISRNLGSVLLALFDISSAVGRVGLGRFCDVVGPLTTMSSLCIAIILSAISMLVIWPETNSLAPFVVFVLINGLGNGGFKFATLTYRRSACLRFEQEGRFGDGRHFPVVDAGRTSYRPAMYYAGSMSLGSLLFVLSARRIFSRRFFAVA